MTSGTKIGLWRTIKGYYGQMRLKSFIVKFLCSLFNITLKRILCIFNDV